MALAGFKPTIKAYVIGKVHSFEHQLLAMGKLFRSNRSTTEHMNI